MFQAVFLWFMPLVVIVIAVEDCIEYQKIGYQDILISKAGKKQYILHQLLKGFWAIFLLVEFALVINLILVHIVFEGGQFSPYSMDGTISELHNWEMSLPIVTNLIFATITAFFSGLITMVGIITTFQTNDRRIVYGITLIFWFVPFLRKNSLMLLFQPYAEYGIETLMPIGVSVGLLYMLYILLCYGRKVWFDKTSI